MLLGWFAVCWLHYAFMLFKHLHKKCAAASSSNHQESKGRSCSFSSGPFFPCPARWLALFCCFQGFLSLFPLPPAANWSPCSICPSFYSSLFTGLKCWCWDPFLLVTWSIQTATIQAALHAASAPLTPGLFSSTMHILEMPHCLVKALLFPIPSLVLSSVTANPQDCTHHFFPAGKEFLLLFICSYPIPKRHSWSLKVIIQSTCPTEEGKLIARDPQYVFENHSI